MITKIIKKTGLSNQTNATTLYTTSEEFSPLPLKIFDYGTDSKLTINYPWEQDILEGLIQPSEDSIKKYKTLIRFVSRFAEKTENLDPSFSQIIKKRFWDLI